MQFILDRTSGRQISPDDIPEAKLVHAAMDAADAHGNMTKDAPVMYWAVEFNTVEELFAFEKRYGGLIVGHGAKFIPTLTIIDSAISYGEVKP